MLGYSDSMLRGIHKVDQIDGDGFVLTTAFLPDTRTNEGRNDNYYETSINWEDDEYALSLTLKAYPNGAVRLARKELDQINEFPSVQGGLFYERKPKIDNPYHGNILFDKAISKAKQKMIAGILALASSKVIHKVC